MEEAAKVNGGGLGNLFERQVLEVRQLAGGLDHVTRLVSSNLPKRSRCQVGRIGFHEQAVEGRPRSRVAQLLCAGERQDSLHR